MPNSLSLTNIHDLRLFGPGSRPRELDLCADDLTTLSREIHEDLKRLISTRVFQKHFDGYLPTGNEINEVNIHVTENTIRVRAQTIDLNRVDDHSAAEIAEVAGINAKIIRKANSIYREHQNSHSPSPNSSPLRGRASNLSHHSRTAIRSESPDHSPARLARSLSPESLRRSASKSPLLEEIETLEKAKETLERKLNALEKSHESLKTTLNKATPSISTDDFVALRELSEDLDSSTDPTIKDRFKALVPEEVRNSIYYQASLLSDRTSVPHAWKSKAGEWFFQENSPMSNASRAQAIRHFLLSALSNEFASIPGEDPSELLEKFDQLCDSDKKAVYIQLQHIHGLNETPEDARDAFHAKNGQKTTNADRGRALGHVLQKRMAKFLRSQLDSAEQKHQMALEALRLRAEAKIQSLDTNVLSLQTQLGAAQGDVLKYRTEASKLATELNTTKLKLEQAEKDLVANTKDLQAAKKTIASLESDIQQTHLDLEQAETWLKVADQRGGDLQAEVERLSLDNQAQNTQLVTLNKELEETRRQRVAAETEVTRIAKENDELADGLKHAKQKIIDALGRENGLNENIVALTQDNEKHKSELTTARAELEETRKQKLAAETEVTRIAKENDELADGLKQAEQKITEASAREKGLNENIVALTQDNEKHKAEFTTARAELEETRKQKLAAETEITRIAKEKDKLADGLKQAEQKITDASAREKGLNDTIAALGQANKRQGAEFTTARAELEETRKQKLAAETEITKIAKENDELANRLKQAEQKITDASAREKGLNDTIAALGQANKRQGAEFTTARAELEETRKQKLAAETEITKIAKENDELANRLKQAEQKITDASAREKGLNDTIAALGQANKGQGAELTTARTTLEETRKQKLAAETEVTRIAKEKGKLADGLKQAEQKIIDASGREKGLNENIVALTQDNEKHKSELTTARAELEKTKQQKVAAEAEVDRITEESDELVDGLKQADQKITDASAREKSLNENIVALTQDNEKHKSELTTAQGTLKETERQKAAALAEVTRLEKEKDKLAEGLKQAEQIVEDVSAYEKSLNENTVALAQDNEKYKSELMAARAELEKARHQKVAAEAEVDRITEEKDELANGLKQAQQTVKDASAREKSLNESIVALAQDNEKYKSELTAALAELDEVKKQRKKLEQMPSAWQKKTTHWLIGSNWLNNRLKKPQLVKKASMKISLLLLKTMRNVNLNSRLPKALSKRLKDRKLQHLQK